MHVGFRLLSYVKIFDEIFLSVAVLSAREKSSVEYSEYVFRLN